MILKNYCKVLYLIFLIVSWSNSQNIVSGYVIDQNTNQPIVDVKIYSSSEGLIANSDSNGFFEIDVETNSIITFFFEEYRVSENTFAELNEDSMVYLEPILEQLDEIEIISRNEKIFSLQRLNEFEGTTIFEGKKNEVVLVDQSMANLASNNSRQIYSQVAGLNIFQNDDAGIQLNIGGRGLDPNRTSNFNTRQNGYDISADVLGYPESYYIPPSEAIKNIQIIRGAASLQYGTQFGGLVNFVLKEPKVNQEGEFTIRNTIGNNNLYTNFLCYKGSKSKFRYLTYFNFKQGDGFRENSFFNSKNLFLKTIYDFDSTKKLSLDLTYFTYLAQQAGGLNDVMFETDPFQSNRSRNWFNVDWFLYNLKYEHEITSSNIFTISLFGLHAVRNALGFRVNRVDQIDSFGPRDLIHGEFNNVGAEMRYLNNYNFFGNESIFVIGTKLYFSNNFSRQGPGSDFSNADFNFYDSEFPNYVNQSDYNYPNENISIFVENIIKPIENLSITPGIRLEYIDTNADGSYERILQDAALNVIQHDTIYESKKNERLFLLSGVGVSYEISSEVDLYSNFSQNYRSVTFADISTVNPAYAIDPNIQDESGFTFDFGVRGNIKNILSYDLSTFFLSYDNRIGFIQKLFDDGNIKAYRTNTGDAEIYGLESLLDFNLKKILNLDNRFIMSSFFNFSLIGSSYVSSNEPGIEGKEVEFVPKYNFKTGLRFGYKNFTSYLQYSYLSDQFSDSSNSISSNLSGVIGQIPAYDILDFSANYSFKAFRIETGINNILDNYYFTRRATGYPGPGIIPSPPRNYYCTVQFKF